MEKSLSTHSKLVGGGYPATDQPRAKPVRVEAAPSVQRDTVGQRGCLSANRIFRDLSPDEMKMITGSTVKTTALNGKVIYTPGETGKVLFLLCQGSVHVYHPLASNRNSLSLPEILARLV
jgi:hypothetical protein